MQIQITFIGKQGNIDLSVDNRQKIIDTLGILVESGDVISVADIDRIRYVKSQRKNKYVPVLFSYQEANIFSGDILVIDNKTS